jgi:uncharacterized protein
MDTSALAKWYVPESRSDDVEAFLHHTGSVAISTLTVLEMRSLLARRVRDGTIDATHEHRVLSAMEQDVAAGHLRRHSVGDADVMAAGRLFDLLPHLPLRALDALHLAVASSVGATVVATADRVMAAAAQALKLDVVRFD